MASGKTSSKLGTRERDDFHVGHRSGLGVECSSKIAGTTFPVCSSIEAGSLGKSKTVEELASLLATVMPCLFVHACEQH